MSLRAETVSRGRRVPRALDDFLTGLVTGAPPEARARLAARLAAARWAPPELARTLAEDVIDAALPVILRSPHLRDYDLMRVFMEGAQEHQMAVARRPGVSPPLVEMILQTNDPVLLTVLATNDKAQLPAGAMRRLVAASRRNAALRTPLARHPGLTREHAERLAGFGDEALRGLLASRFKLSAPPARRAPAGSEEQLVDKLEQAGELRLGYLVEALRDGHLPQFIAALAKLGGFTPADIRAAVSSERPELLALACASVGIDQRVFPTLLAGVRALNGGKPGGGDEGARRAEGAFAPFAPAMAARAFRRTIAAV